MSCERIPVLAGTGFTVETAGLMALAAANLLAKFIGKSAGLRLAVDLNMVDITGGLVVTKTPV